ncbi:unnamed protein product [Haemonchus placei]|uniref:Ig-like domain-containing protein n=1 Tax=Haemonchus placei TaxID=6290 RepID=A0A0N4WLE8_HAEPC|nr:unnamed protein product [Haemonchus placei]
MNDDCVEFPAIGILSIKEFARIDNRINISYQTTDFVEGDNLITYFEISMELLRPLRTEVYPYVVEKVEVPKYDGTYRVYSINESYFAGSIYDKMNITITPQVGDYKGLSKDLLVALHLPPDAVKPLTRRAGRFKAVMPLECAEFVSGESECFWEMLIKDDVEKPLTRPRKFHNGTEIPELRTIEVFLDESYTNKPTLFFCYVKRSTKYDVHKWTTAIEVVPILSQQLKPKLTVDVVEQRPRHLVIKWSMDDLPANISGIRLGNGGVVNDHGRVRRAPMWAEFVTKIHKLVPRCPGDQEKVDRGIILEIGIDMCLKNILISYWSQDLIAFLKPAPSREYSSPHTQE